MFVMPILLYVISESKLSAIHSNHKELEQTAISKAEYQYFYLTTMITMNLLTLKHA